MCVFIDGGNFFHLVLKKLGIRELDFSFDEFVEYLAHGRKIPSLGKRYYVGTVREKEGDRKEQRDDVETNNTLYLPQIPSVGDQN